MRNPICLIRGHLYGEWEHPGIYVVGNHRRCMRTGCTKFQWQTRPTATRRRFQLGVVLFGFAAAGLATWLVMWAVGL